MYTHNDKHIHTHKHIYIYIYIYNVHVNKHKKLSNNIQFLYTFHQCIMIKLKKKLIFAIFDKENGWKRKTLLQSFPKRQCI